MPEGIFVHGCHGSAEIHTPTKYALHGLRSEEVVIVLDAIFGNGCHGNTQIHIRTKFHFHALHGFQV